MAWQTSPPTPEQIEEFKKDVAARAGIALAAKGIVDTTQKLRQLIDKGWQVTYAELFGQRFVDSLDSVETDDRHHSEAIEWHWNARIALLKGERPPNDWFAYFPIFSRGNMKTYLAEHIAVMDAVLSVAYKTPGFCLYIGREKDKVKENISNIETILSSEPIRRYAPTLSQVKRNDETGQKRQWTGTFLHTGGRYVFKAATVESAQAGSKIEDTRVTFFCHKKGTPIFTGGRWMPVEDHPTATLRNNEVGVNVRIHGQPHEETVTNEHRYWVRRRFALLRNGKETQAFSAKYTTQWEPDQWREAKDLDKNCFIGHPIDRTVSNPQPIFKYGRIIEHNGINGRTSGTKVFDSEFIPPEFFDKDWWWLFGLWWGDGHTANKKTVVVLTIARKDTTTFNRITELLNRYDLPFLIGHEKPGCFCVQFNHAALGRWLNTWYVTKKKKGQKCPPLWVEQLSFEYQAELIKGYVAADGFVDYKAKAVRITSVSLDGLQAVRRILARLNIPASIRIGMKPSFATFDGVTYKTQRKYDIRFRQNAHLLGYDIYPQERYAVTHNFIADGFLWSKVKSLDISEECTFVPIQTPTEEYVTAFGRSHNCPDDIDDRNQSPVIAETKFRLLTSEILPMRQANTLTFFAQNLINRYSTMYRIQSGQSAVLANRKPTEPIPAVRGLVTERRTIDGQIRDIVVAGKCTWRVWNLIRVQDEIDTYTLPVFLAECQHAVEQSKEGVILYNYNDDAHVISESEFAAVYGSKDAWLSWRKKPGNDWARTKTDKHANVAGWLTVSSQDTPFPNFTFLMHPMSFPANTAPEDVAERLLSCLSPYAYETKDAKVTWAEVRKDVLRRVNADIHTATVAEKIDYEHGELARIIPQYSKPLLQRCNVQQGEMSHEQDTVRKIYSRVYGLGMKATNPRKHGGTENINRDMRVDYDEPHAFRPESKGYTQWAMVVPDDVEKGAYNKVSGMPVYHPKAYPTAMQTKELQDDDLCRFHLSNCRYRPPILTTTGEEIDVPEKIYDDFFNMLQFFYVGNPLKGTSLTMEQKVSLAVPFAVKEASRNARTGEERLVAAMEFEFQRDIAMDRLNPPEQRMEDMFE